MAKPHGYDPYNSANTHTHPYDSVPFHAPIKSEAVANLAMAPWDSPPDAPEGAVTSQE
jgi:hypothetical protein